MTSVGSSLPDAQDREPIGSRESTREQMALLSLFVVLAAMATATRLSWWAPGAYLVAVCLWVPLVFFHVLRVPHAAIIGVLALTVFQDVLVGIFAGREGSRGGVLLVVVLTTALPAGLAGWFAVVRRFDLLKDRLLLPLNFSALVYVLIVLASTVLGGQSPQALLPALRNALAFLVMFYCGLMTPRLSVARLRRVVIGFWGITGAVLVFGYLERFALGDAFWVEVLNLDILAAIKNLTLTTVVPWRVPADFYSPIGGNYYRRMASLFGTPISLGYYVAFAFLFLLPFASPFRRSAWTPLRGLSMLILGTTLALSLVKGAWGIAALGVMALVLVALGNRLGWSFGRIASAWIVGAVPAVALGVLLFPASTAWLHVYGLVVTFQSLGPVSLLVGNGIGTGGTISQRLGADVAVSEATGAESGVGTLLYQTGAVGTAVYLLFSILLIKALFDLHRDETLAGWLRTGALGVLAALFGLLGAVFLQENALAPIPIAPFYIFAGAFLNVAHRERQTRRRINRLNSWPNG